MRNPYLKNVNTISLKFIEGDRNYKDVITVLKDHISLAIKHDLLGLGYAGKDSVHVICLPMTKYTTRPQNTMMAILMTATMIPHSSY